MIDGAKQLTEDDLIKSAYEAIIESCDTKECHKYGTIFFQKAKELESSDDSTSFVIFILFGRLSSLNLRAETALHPFSPMPSGPLENQPQDFVQIFSQEHLTFLEQIVNHISDNELKSRIADVLWVINHDYKMAELAISAYLESSKILEHPENWTSCEERIQRAFRLANLIGNKGSYLANVIRHLEDVLTKYNGDDPLFLSKKLMSLLLEAKHGDYEKYINLSKKCAVNAEKKNNFHVARAYWRVKGKWHKLQDNIDEERDALLRHADTYVKEAEFKVNGGKGSYSVASHFLQKAIEAYRCIGNTREVVDEIHKKLVKYQKKSMKEMQEISNEFDVTESVRKAIENVRGKSFYDAIFSLCLMFYSPKVEDLKRQVKENAEKFPLQHLASGIIVNQMGKVIGQQANIFSGDPKEVEEATRQNMLRHAEFHRLFITQSIIEPARHHIILEHSPQLSDLMPIVYDNQLIPQNREKIFATGLLNGLEGNFIEAAHLLIPQIENSMRFLLAKKGVVTSSIDSNGIQNERNLNDTLYASEIEEIFGTNIIFDLQGLLVEKFGVNLRHRMAHGLMDYASFFNFNVSYLWALILKLCCWPLINIRYNSEN
ncbi:MAG: DUF4209 domain-containing protein [Desulfobaccales bacterium]